MILRIPISPYTLRIMEPSITTTALAEDPRAGLELASRLGFRRVTLSAAQPGLRPRDLDRSARRGLQAELRRLELACDAIDLFIPPEHFTQASTIDRALDAVSGAVQLASDLGAGGVFLRLPPEDPEEPMLEATIELTRLAQGSPVRLLDVGLNGRALRTLEAGNATALGIGIDTAAWLADHRDPLEGLVAHGALVGGLRLVDLDETGSRTPPERGGRLDLDSLQRALALETSPRSVVLDARGWAEPQTGAVQALTAWREATTL
ncbi:MAG: hypothetical protein VX641_03060 [Planctomycetota bacterium]|nr:hypothetical protein [Planctomycetota bacterium]